MNQMSYGPKYLTGQRSCDILASIKSWLTAQFLLVKGDGEWGTESMRVILNPYFSLLGSGIEISFPTCKL